MFKCQNKLSNGFRFKDRTPKELTSGAVYKFQCGLCHERYLSVKIIRHVGISSLIKKEVKLKGGVVSNHLLLCAIHDHVTYAIQHLE